MGLQKRFITIPALFNNSIHDQEENHVD